MGKWIIDYAHSTIGFEVKHMMVSKVRGHFDSFTATVEADNLMDLTTANISFQFDADSINTRHHERDQHLKSADFFDIQHYPKIDFVSTQIEKNGNDYEITGDLTIKETTKSITFHVEYGGKAISREGIEVYGFEGYTTINREDFGLTWNELLETGGVLVGKSVKIYVELELHNQNRVISHPLTQHHSSAKTISQLITENITDFIAVINRNGDIQYVSPSFKKELNKDSTESNFFENIHSDDQHTVREEIATYSSRTINKALKSEFRFLHTEGHYIHVESDIIMVKNQTLSKDDLILVVMRDIGEQKEAEKAIYQLAFHDPVTDLPNRRAFMNNLQNEIINQKVLTSKLSIMFIDLDNFKSINDQWGHDAGDYVLKEAAKRIKSSIRLTDVAARFGGDEFIVMLKDVQNEDDIHTIIKKIFTNMQKPIKKLNQEYTITCSIGVANYPDHAKTSEDLIKNADTALYYVKEQGKNDFILFNQQMEAQSLERRILESALRKGIKEQQFYLEYQPKVNIATGELIGMEALLRWHHPDLGIISPGKFIPLAEETGLIIPLGEWVLREGARQLSEWQLLWKDTDYPALKLSVNVSVHQLEDQHFLDQIKSVLQETGINPQWLELEITESVLANVKNTKSILSEIQELGIQISVDDFGTGYSSLSYIKDLPIDTLKIDQSFVKDIHTNKESKEIAKAIINLAKSIGLNVIAEGVEQQEQADELNKTAHILGQGYFYSRPLKKEDFEAYLTTAFKNDKIKK